MFRLKSVKKKESPKGLPETGELVNRVRYAAYVSS